MKQPIVFLAGKKLPLGKRLGKGGEGEVYAVEDGSGRALKYYTAGDGLTRESKVTAMIRARLADRLPLVAFPIDIVRHKDGSFAGFVMKMFSGHRALHDLYAPKARKQNFPKSDYRFLIRAASNIARVIASVYPSGCVIGDVNHSGLLVSEAAIAGLIDADSFQFVEGNERHFCLVGVPEYTAPELQGQTLRNVFRTQDHDAFGLAIVVFQLLFMGRHPFMGSYARGEMPIERAIAEHRFAYSQLRSVGMTPPPGICTLKDFPAEIGAAFEAAFSPDRARDRPTAEQWAGLLQALEHSLRRCSANDLHYFPSAAQGCPWCKLENQVGLVLFIPNFLGTVGPAGIDPGAASFNLVAIWAAIDSIQIPQRGAITPVLPVVEVKPSDEAAAAKQLRLMKRVGGLGAIIAALIVMAAAGALWPLWGVLGWFGLAAFFGGASASLQFNKRYISAHQQWDAGLRGWQERCGFVEATSLKESLVDAKRAYERLPRDEQSKLETYRQNRRRIQLENYLDRFQIRRARIRGIGPAKEAALASYGIETAEDIGLNAVLRVPGFGPATAQGLLDWRKRLETRFVYDDRPNALDQQEMGKIRTEFATRASDLRRKLIVGSRDLRNAVQTIEARVKIPDPVLKRLNIEKRQAEADLELLQAPLPSVPKASSLRSPPINSARTPTWQTGRPAGAGTGSASNCPRCGSRMVKRTARRGPNRGNTFWGCSRYPQCTGTRSHLP